MSIAILYWPPQSWQPDLKLCLQSLTEVEATLSDTRCVIFPFWLNNFISRYLTILLRVDDTSFHIWRINDSNIHVVWFLTAILSSISFFCVLSKVPSVWSSDNGADVRGNDKTSAMPIFPWRAKKLMLSERLHYLKSVQIRNYLWSVFFRIWSEYGEIADTGKYGPEITPYLGTFYAVLWINNFYYRQC